MELLTTVIPMALLLLSDDVDPQPVLRAGFHRGDIMVVSCVGIGQIGIDGKEVQVREDVAWPLSAMIAHAAADGFEIRVNFGFRDNREQKRQWRKARRWAAPPGYSNHQSGVSVDIDGTRKRRGRRLVRTALYWWLVENAGTYGFVNDIPREPWHWTFVGLPDEDLELALSAEEK